MTEILIWVVYNAKPSRISVFPLFKIFKMELEDITAESEDDTNMDITFHVWIDHLSMKNDEMKLATYVL